MMVRSFLIAMLLLLSSAFSAHAAPAFYGVVSAAHTATEGVDDLVIDADPGNGRANFPFTWSASDTNGVAPQVTQWMETHPDFPIAAYVAPVPAPADYQLTKRQISAALIVSGTTTDPNTYVLGVLGKITDDTQRALALNDWNNPPEAGWAYTDPLIASIAAGAGLSQDQIAQFWLLGAQQSK